MIDQTISHYKIIEKLGEGGMGVVYKAQDTKLDRTVALKFLPSNIVISEEEKSRFIREAQASANLDHPNICTVHDFNESDGEAFITMAYVEGESLKEKIQRGPIELTEVISITKQICEGLQSAHEAGIVHRDIKGANIMVNEKGLVKIMDFGLAKLSGQTQLTKTGMTLGTVAYMSPEQAQGGKVDQRTDIWALGVVIYEMLTGQLPFASEYEQAMIYSIVNEEPQSVSKLREDIPPDFEKIIQKALEKNLESRYQNTEEILFDLRKILDEASISFDESLKNLLSRLWRKKLVRRIFTAVAAVLLIAVILTLFWPEITEPVPIAVISFENQTGDAQYDILSKSIPNLLITNLEQSGRFKVVPWERLNELKKRIGKDSIEFINSELGMELCSMAGISNIVVGSIAKVGDIFATDLRILDVDSKEILQTAQSRGEGDKSVFKQIDELTKEIATGLGGVSKENYSQANVSIMNVTSNSIEAYNYFLKGREELSKDYYVEARKFLKKAIEIDSTFASAYLHLGTVYDILGYSRAKISSFQKAKKYSVKATEKERLWIDVWYSAIIEKDMEKHIEILNDLVRKYPHERKALSHLASHSDNDKQYEIYNKLLSSDPDYIPAIRSLAYWNARNGNLKKAEEYIKRYASLSPGDSKPFQTMGNIYFLSGKLEAAISNYKEALFIKPEFGADWIIAYIYALQGNYESAMQWIDQYIASAPSPHIKAKGFHFKGFYNYWMGRFNLALKYYDESIALSNEIQKEDDVGFVNYLKAWLYYDKGEYDLAINHMKQCVDTWIRNHPDWEANNRAGHKFFLSMIDLKNGHIDAAEKKIAESNSFVEKIKNWKSESVFQYNLLKTELLLAKDSVDKAINLYEKEVSSKFPGLIWSWVIIHNLVGNDVLARAYVQKGNIDNAIAEYERLTSIDPKDRHRILVKPDYYYLLAKLYQKKGLKNLAIQNYEKVLDIWKNAQAEFTEKIDAKKRLEQLAL